MVLKIFCQARMAPELQATDEAEYHGGTDVEAKVFSLCARKQKGLRKWISPILFQGKI